MPEKPLNHVLSGYGTTIFSTMSALAVAHQAINLGQGFPDQDGPEDIREVAAKALMDGPNQYPPSQGIPELRQAVAAHNKRFYGLEIDWQSQVLVTSGATEAVAASLLALLNPGDEVVLFEPMYDCYLPIAQLAGAVARPVRLRPPAWDLPREALRAACNEKTKLIVLNSPMNPTGKVFSRDELQFIADLAIAHNAIVICDEVYEHLTFDGAAHIPLMTLPGMDGRCVRIGSAGKSFSLTGWKVGYITAPPALAEIISKAHQFLTFTTAPNLQKAVAYGLAKDDTYFATLASDMQAKRDLLGDGLRRIGFDILPCQGTYFIAADYTPFARDGEDDAAFCKRITIEAGVAAVPFSAFSMAAMPGGTETLPQEKLIRFCFCKQDSVLQDALARLRRYLG
ncbi:MAG TPA: aminotransferase [Alphaproteobacteria bacterium]|nr:aminotransferase [Alphaproteobacteria bacterium]